MTTNWFAGINQAASGLNAARSGLAVVGQNMTNASSSGYVKRTVTQTSVELGGVNAVRSGGTTMSGAITTSVARSTDEVLDARVRAEHSKAQLASTTAATLSDVDTTLGEPSDTGLASQLSDFWAAWGTVANNPGTDPAGNSARQALLGKAATVVGSLNTMGSALADQVGSTAQSLTGDVGSLNTAAAQLATVNGSIAVGTATGADVNDLLDQRDQLLDSIGKLAGGTATVNADGTATVSIGGQTLVSGVTAATVAVDSSYDVTVGGQQAAIDGGSVAARTAALTTTLPGFQASLDAVADQLAAVVNAAQTSSYDGSGNAGAAMFTGSGATGITLAITDPGGVATTATAGAQDGGVASQLSQSGAVAGSPDSLFSALVATVATASSAATQQSTTQASVASSVDALKTSMSGVSLDEEASQMLVYQQAFNASARILTAMDSMLDTLINHTGTVGLS